MLRPQYMMFPSKPLQPATTMTTRKYARHTIPAPQSHDIPVYLWESGETASAVIQIIHGLGEHSARYERFALQAVDRGYAVCAHDHRGHGPHSPSIGYFAADNGWQLLVEDSNTVSQFLQQRYATLPIVLLGHSMGSYVAQSYAMRFGDQLSALVLSGSTWPSRPLLTVGRMLARMLALFRGKNAHSALLDKMGFGDFNKKFEPARTELDWLSRDAAEVDKYVDDPFCGGPYTTGLWIDLLGGLLQISTDGALRKIPAALPILLTGGSDDPVGGQKGISELAEHYESTGHRALTTRIYPGGRHEMFNETNRDEFSSDLLRWIEATLAERQVSE